MKKNMKRVILTLISILLAFILLNNLIVMRDSHFIDTKKILAHRGLAQTFDIEDVKWDTNTARIIHKPEHNFIENSIPSMQASFRYGADLVEFDIRLTKDRKIVVFHDYNVDFRTEKTGNVSDYTLEQLQRMDIGYGYTYDNGKSFPFRGKGIGLMPSFDQVISEFPQKDFLIHIKDSGPEIGILLLEKFKMMNKTQIQHFSIYGNDVAITIIREEYPEMKAFTARMIKKAFIEYELIGWTGFISKSIRNMEFHIPIEYSKFLWGWPEKFVMRMNSVNTRVVLVQKKGPWTGGFNTQEEIERIPDNYYGYLLTDRIDKIWHLFE